MARACNEIGPYFCKKGFFSSSIRVYCHPGFYVFVYLVAEHRFGKSGTNKDRLEDVKAGKKQKKEDKMEGADKLTDEQGEYLLSVARKTIQESLFGGKVADKRDKNLSPIYKEKRGTFVTLTMGGNLRGCIGHIMAQETLIEGIKVNAFNAVFGDPRFNPVGKNEWDRVKIEVSILTDPKPLSYSGAEDHLKKLRPGMDGVILKKGIVSLPSFPRYGNNCRKRRFPQSALPEGGVRRGCLEKRGS